MRVTVGICAYNEANNIGCLLDNILNEQELPLDAEVLVVSSGCTDGTTKIVQHYAELDPRVRIYVEKERLGKASAMNQILANGKGDAFLFISADTLPWKSCFKQLIYGLHAPEVGVVCGRPVPIDHHKSLTDKLVNVLWDFHDHVFRELNDAGLARHATEVFCVRKGIVESIPNETINDDSYIALLAKKKGWLINYNSESCVSICGPRTFSDYIKQRRRILLGHSQVRKTTGEVPQHLLYLFPKHPVIVVQLLLWLIKKYGFITFFTFALVELIISCLALIDSISKKPSAVWSIATSTKNLNQGAVYHV